MKHLRGFSNRYFSLAVIAMYSTLFKLCKTDSNRVYHLKSHIIKIPKTSPPDLLSFQIV